MLVSRERYLDDSSDLHLTITLATRTGIMHSLLSNVPDSAREAVSEILVEALDRVEEVLKPHVARHATRP